MKFQAIVADPPWDYDPPGRRQLNENSSWYKDAEGTLSADKLKLADIPSMVNCLMFLWTPARNIPVALDVLCTWGFKYYLQIVWVKSNKDRTKPAIGIGGSLRMCHENLLVGKRGKPVILDRNVPHAPEAR